MEMKPIADGYKKTPAGVIPNDWSVRRMGGVARVVSGQVDPRIEPYSLMPLVAPDHIESGAGRLARSIATAAEQRAISGKYLFRSGTVIYSKIRPHLRKVCIAPFDGLCSADMYPLLPADDVHPGFLFASLLSERFSKYAESVSIRSGMPKINRDELAGFEFLLPSTRQEQAQIAGTLVDADALIESLEQLLTKKRQIKQGAMQELL
ncbi:restriction endonuclease subunit S, partial [Roseateles sp.]|uniref:restriction endonuclease subunit S n=1 Tax=Roseateles sp. TaxID=1971397 RepID=UPI003BA60CD9